MPDIPDAAELGRHIDFLRRIASRLVRDEHTAEDLVQDACVAALVKPPAAEVPRRPWLAGVVRNLARMRHRSEGRRRRRELLAARPELTRPADALASLEITRRLVAAVADLAEPYRIVLVLRYLHDQKPAEIARRLAMPVETVRTRLRRARERLRSRLDERHDGDRRAWILALLPLTEGVVMKKVSVSLVALLLLLLLVVLPAYLLSTGPATSGPVTPGIGADSLTARGPGSFSTRAESSVPTVVGEPAVDDLPPDDTARIRVRSPGGHPVAGARITLLKSYYDLDMYVGGEVVATAVSDEEGGVTFPVVPFARYFLKAVHPDFAVTGDVECFGGNVAALVMKAGGSIAGTVRDAESGLPLSGATVYAMDWIEIGVLHEWRTVTDREGRYRIDRVGEGKLNMEAWVADSPHVFPDQTVTVNAGRTTEVDFRLPRGAPLVLRVLDDESGRPVPSVTVRFGPAAPMTGPGSGFPTRPLGPVWPFTITLDAAGYADRILFVERASLPSPTGPLIVRLTKGLQVTGRVRTLNGEVAAGVKIQFWAEPDPRTEMVNFEAVTDADGVFLMRGAHPGGRLRFEIMRSAEARQASRWIPVPSDAKELRLGTIHLATTVTISGRVLSPEGEPITRGLVTVYRPEELPRFPKGEAYLDPRGRFRLTGIPAGPSRIRVRRIEGWPDQDLVLDLQGDREEDVTLPAGMEVSGRVVDAAGKPAVLESVSVLPSNVLVRTDAEGRFRLRGLGPGPHQVYLSYYRSVAIENVAGNTFDLRLVRP